MYSKLAPFKFFINPTNPSIYDYRYTPINKLLSRCLLKIENFIDTSFILIIKKTLSLSIKAVSCQRTIQFLFQKRMEIPGKPRKLRKPWTL